MTLIFDKLAPPEYMFQKSIAAQTAVSEELKTWYFLYSAFWLTGLALSPPPSPPRATLLPGIIINVAVKIKN